MVDYRTIASKVIAVVVTSLYMNSLFIFLAPQVYFSLLTLIPILLLTIVTCFDVAIRSASTKPDRYNRAIVGIAFLLFPLMVALPYAEFVWLTSTYPIGFINLNFVLGVLVLFAGSSILIASRLQIGQYGGSKIAIEDEHKLVTDRMYRYIRNPQYLGFLLLFSGYSFSFSSMIVMFVTATGLFVIFRSRMLLEENILLETFGTEYQEYMNRTWRLLPHIY
jgi:protein-S-isoprenylcysteine O-methyltransferase Ste14